MNADHPSRFQLDRFLHGEGDDQLRAHVEACPRCRSRLDTARAQAAQFLAQHPSPESIGVRSGPPSGKWRSRWLTVAAAAAIAALTAVLPSSRESTERMKGGSAIEVLVRRAESTAPQAFAGESLREGDTLVLAYTTEKKYLLLANLEDSGSCEIVIATGVTPGQRKILDRGVRLDAHQGKERFVAFFSDQPLDEAAVKAALGERAARGGDLESLDLSGLFSNADQVTWLITKEAAR